MSQPDTQQQKAILRMSKTARATRKRFPVGTVVTSRDHDTGINGTVLRHVPSTNGQGGSLTVRWDNGRVQPGVGPISVKVVDDPARM